MKLGKPFVSFVTLAKGSLYPELQSYGYWKHGRSLTLKGIYIKERDIHRILQPLSNFHCRNVLYCS